MFLPFGFGQHRSVVSKFVEVEGVWRVLEESSTHYHMEREDGYRAWYPKYAVSLPDSDGTITMDEWCRESNPAPHYSEYLHSVRRIAKVPAVSFGYDGKEGAAKMDASIGLEKSSLKPRFDEHLNRMVLDRVSLDQVLDFQMCPRRFYLSHLLSLPDRVSFDDAKQYAVSELFRLVMKSDLRARPASDYVHALAPLVWSKTRKWYFSYLRRDGHFDVHEIRRIKKQVLFAVQQSLAWATGRSAFPSVPLPSELPTVDSQFPELDVSVQFDHYSLSGHKTIVSDSIQALNNPAKFCKSTVQMFLSGHHNDKYSRTEYRDTDKLILQSWMLEKTRGVVADQAAAALCAPRVPGILTNDREAMEAVRSNFSRSLDSLCETVGRLPSSFDGTEETERKVGKQNGPESEIPVSTSESENMFAAKTDFNNCLTCKFRAFCHPFVAEYEKRSIIEDNHKWLFGKALAVERVYDDPSSADFDPLTRIEIEPNERRFRDFTLEHKGVRGRRMLDAKVGDHVGLVDVCLRSHDVLDYVFADLHDPYSLLINGCVPSLSKIKSYAAQETEFARAQVARLGNVDLSRSEYSIYDIADLEHFEF